MPLLFAAQLVFSRGVNSNDQAVVLYIRVILIGAFFQPYSDILPPWQF